MVTTTTTTSRTSSSNLSMSLKSSPSPPSSNEDGDRRFESLSGRDSNPIQSSYDLPSELWFRIFQFATTVLDIWSVDVGDPFDSSVSGQTPISDPTDEQRRIKASISTKWHLILVSHKWHDLALPILYDCIYLRRFRDLFLVYHTLSKSQQHHNGNNSQSLVSTSMATPMSIRISPPASASTTTPPLGWWTHRLDLCMPDVLPLSDSHSNSTDLHPLPLLLTLLPHLKILTISASVSPPPHLPPFPFPSDESPTSIPIQIQLQYSSYSSIRCPSLHIPAATLVSLSKSLERLSWRADSEWVLQPDKETYWGILRYLANGKGKLRTFESGMGGWNLFVDFCLLCDCGAEKGMDGEVESISASTSELRHCAVLPVWHKCNPAPNVSSGIHSSTSTSPSSPSLQPQYPYPNLTSISLRVLSAQIHLLPFLPHFLTIQGPLLQSIYLYVVDPPALAPTLELIGEYCPALTKVVLDVPERVWSMGDYGFLSEKLPVEVRYLGLRMEWSGPDCEESDGGDVEAEDVDESGRKRGPHRRVVSALDEGRRKVVWESILRVLSGRSSFQIHHNSAPRFLRPGTNTSTASEPTTDGLIERTGGGLTVIRILEKHWCSWLRGRNEMGLESNDEDGEWCREFRRRGVRVEDMWGVEYDV